MNGTKGGSKIFVMELPPLFLEDFTSELVMKTIKDRGIELIDYTKVGTRGK